MVPTMIPVPWLQFASDYLDDEIKRLKQAGYPILHSQIGSIVLDVSNDLQRIGCCAVQVITINRRKMLTVMVTVVNAASCSMTEDGFTMTPRGKIVPLYTDYYDD
jgi:hypothetical protein